MLVLLWEKWKGKTMHGKEVMLGTPSVSWTYAQRSGGKKRGCLGDYAQRTLRIPKTLILRQPLYKEHKGFLLSLHNHSLNLRNPKIAVPPP